MLRKMKSENPQDRQLYTLRCQGTQNTTSCCSRMPTKLKQPDLITQTSDTLVTGHDLEASFLLTGSHSAKGATKAAQEKLSKSDPAVITANYKNPLADKICPLTK